MGTIDIQAREWFDKVNGNSYFSAIVTINYGMESEMEIKIPFQYGYGDHYLDVAYRTLQNEGIIVADKMERLWQYCERFGVILRCSKQENCLKRDVVNFTK